MTHIAHIFSSLHWLPSSSGFILRLCSSHIQPCVVRHLCNRLETFNQKCWLLVLSLSEFQWGMLNTFFLLSLGIFSLLCCPSCPGHFKVSPQTSFLLTVCVAVTLSSHVGALYPEGVVELRACDLAGCWMTVSLKSAGSPTPPHNQRNSTQPPSPRCPLVTHNKHPEDTWKPQRFQPELLCH